VCDVCVYVCVCVCCVCMYVCVYVYVLLRIVIFPSMALPIIQRTCEGDASESAFIKFCEKLYPIERVCVCLLVSDVCLCVMCVCVCV